MQGFPAIRYYPAGTNKALDKYSGEPDSDKLKQWLHEKAKNKKGFADFGRDKDGKEHRVAVGCNSTYTPNVRMALANGMFGSSDGMRRDCNATCLFDVRAPSTVAYTWDANRTCWLGQVRTYFFSNVTCPHATPVGTHIDSLAECGEAVAYLASSRTDGQIVLGATDFPPASHASETTSGIVFPYKFGALVPVWQDAAELPLCFLAREQGGDDAYYYRAYFNSLRVTAASGQNDTARQYVCKPAATAACFDEQYSTSRAYAEARSRRMCAAKNKTSVVSWWRDGACRSSSPVSG